MTIATGTGPRRNEGGPPGAFNTPTAQNALDANNSRCAIDAEQPALTTAQELTAYVACVFELDDIVELRRLPSGRSTWHRARQLPTLTAQLTSENATNGVYVGVNPRACTGDGSRADACDGGQCGRCRHCVQLARCLFVDLDETTIDAARFRLSDSGLPAPTLIISSGGGVHVYWRLAEPFTELDEWSDHQHALIPKLGGDPAVHDPPRVMRLPGFSNRKPKYKPPRPCMIIEADPQRVYSALEFGKLPVDKSRSSLSRVASSPQAIHQGQRNATLHRLGSGMRAKGFSDAAINAALAADNLARCTPPLPDAEVQGIAQSVCRYESGVSIRAPMEQGRARIDLLRDIEPVPLSKLGDDEAVNWVWFGYLAFGFITLLTGLWKAGKTTLLKHLLVQFTAGGDLGGRVEPARILVITEEQRSLWKRRRDQMGLGDHVQILVRPFLFRPAPSEWHVLIDRLAEMVRLGRFRVIVFDTIAAFWPVADENYAPQVFAAVSYLRVLSDVGAAVLLVHHPRKGDGTEGQASRGSGALPGFVDVIIELRRYNAADSEDRRRTLTAYSRLEETPPQVVIELGPHGFKTIGTTTDAKQSSRLEVLVPLLPLEPPGLTADEIHTAWPHGSIPKPGRRTVALDLTEAVKKGLLDVLGRGVSGDPYRYTRRKSIRAGPSSLGAQNELGTGGNSSPKSSTKLARTGLDSASAGRI